MSVPAVDRIDVVDERTYRVTFADGLAVRFSVTDLDGVRGATPDPDPFMRGRYGDPRPVVAAVLALHDARAALRAAPAPPGAPQPPAPTPHTGSTGPQNTGPQDTGPQSAGPQHTDPRSADPARSIHGSQSAGPARSGHGPQSAGPQDTGPQNIGSRSADPARRVHGSQSGATGPGGDGPADAGAADSGAAGSGAAPGVGGASRELVDRAVRLARSGELADLGALIDWPLSGAARVFVGLTALPEGNRSWVVDSGLAELDSARADPGVAADVLTALATALAAVRDVVPVPADRRIAALSGWLLPMAPAGLTDAQCTRLAELRHAAATLTTLYELRGPDLVVAVTTDSAFLVVPFPG